MAHAADCLEKVAAANPKLIQPYKDAILRVLSRIGQWPVRSRVCLMLPRLKLSSTERREAFETVRTYLDDESSIVRTFAMQAMFDLSEKDELLRDAAMAVIERAVKSGSPAMRARARHLIKNLTKKGQTRRPVPYS